MTWPNFIFLLKNIFLHLFQFSNVVWAYVCVCVCLCALFHIFLFQCCFLFISHFMTTQRGFSVLVQFNILFLSFSFALCVFFPHSYGNNVLDGLVRLYSFAAISSAPESGIRVCLLSFSSSLSYSILLCPVLLMCIIMRACLFVCLYAKVSGEIYVCSWSAFKIDLYLNVDTW